MPNNSLQLFFDTETSGFYSKNLASNDPKQAWTMQLGVMLSTKDEVFAEMSLLIQSNGRTCNPHAQAVHGISVESCDLAGFSEAYVAQLFKDLVFRSNLLVCHNYNFDINMVCAMIENNISVSDASLLRNLPYYCTMLNSTELCHLPGRYGKPKWPKLQELHKFLFGEEFTGAHSALDDVRATRRCYYAMKERGL